MAQEITIFAACQGMGTRLPALFERFSTISVSLQVQTEPSVVEPPIGTELGDPPAVEEAARADVGLVTVFVGEGVQQIVGPYRQAALPGRLPRLRPDREDLPSEGLVGVLVSGFVLDLPVIGGRGQNAYTIQVIACRQVVLGSRQRDLETFCSSRLKWVLLMTTRSASFGPRPFASPKASTSSSGMLISSTGGAGEACRSRKSQCSFPQAGAIRGIEVQATGRGVHRVVEKLGLGHTRSPERLEDGAVRLVARRKTPGHNPVANGDAVVIRADGEIPEWPGSDASAQVDRCFRCQPLDTKCLYDRTPVVCGENLS